MIDQSNTREMKLLTLAMHPETPDMEALSAIRKLRLIGNDKGGISSISYTGDPNWENPIAPLLKHKNFELGILRTRVSRLEADLSRSDRLRKAWHQRWKAAKAAYDQATHENAAPKLEQCLATLKQVMELASLHIAASAKSELETCAAKSPNAPKLSPARSLDPVIALHGALTYEWQTVGPIYQAARRGGCTAKSQQTIYNRLLKLSTLGVIEQRHASRTTKMWRLKP